MDSAIEERRDGVYIRVRVQPRASRNAISVEPDGRIRAALTAPPVEGEANRALTEFIAKRLGTPRRCVALVSGEKSREKTLRVTGLSAVEVEARLLGALNIGVRARKIGRGF